MLSCALGLHLLAETQDQVKDIKKRMSDLGIELYIYIGVILCSRSSPLGGDAGSGEGYPEEDERSGHRVIYIYNGVILCSRSSPLGGDVGSGEGYQEEDE